MLKRLFISGLFALVVCLCKLAIGAGEVESLSQFLHEPAAAEPERQSLTEGVLSIPQAGLLESRPELGEQFNLIRKFPVAQSLFYYPTYRSVTYAQSNLMLAKLGFIPPKDLLSAYHILRI